MKIIELKNKHIGHWRHTCSECGTVFEFDGDDTKNSYDEEGNYYSLQVECPNRSCRDHSYETGWTDLTNA